MNKWIRFLLFPARRVAASCWGSRPNPRGPRQHRYAATRPSWWTECLVTCSRPRSLFWTGSTGSPSENIFRAFSSASFLLRILSERKDWVFHVSPVDLSCCRFIYLRSSYSWYVEAQIVLEEELCARVAWLVVLFILFLFCISVRAAVRSVGSLQDLDL